jgi:uncharacterized protein YegP (UPF0339 family)
MTTTTALMLTLPGSRFEVYPDAGGFRWRLVDGADVVVAQSAEIFPSEAHACWFVDQVRTLARYARLVDLPPKTSDA